MSDPSEGREPIPISLVAHHVFCPRRAWLETVGETVDSFQMAVGTQAHESSDSAIGSRPHRRRAVDVGGDGVGIVGRCDQVDLDDAGRATVVEYKSTPVRRRAEVTEPMIVQLTLQTDALRASGVEIAGAAVYFTEHHTRIDVSIGEPERQLAWAHVRQTADMIDSGIAPPALEDDRRCMRCSHVGVCLPDERKLEPVRRRVVAADPDSQVLHLQTPGSRASIRSGRVRVNKGDEALGSVPIERVMALVVHGNVDVSSALIREALWRQLPVVWCASSGRVVGWAGSAARPNGGPRVSQHVASSQGHLGLARAFVVAKACQGYSSDRSSLRS